MVSVETEQAGFLTSSSQHDSLGMSAMLLTFWENVHWLLELLNFLCHFCFSKGLPQAPHLIKIKLHSYLRQTRIQRWCSRISIMEFCKHSYLVAQQFSVLTQIHQHHIWGLRKVNSQSRTEILQIRSEMSVLVSLGTRGLSGCVLSSSEPWLHLRIIQEPEES